MFQEWQNLHNFILISEWSLNPVVIIVETTDYPVEKIPFPTVTVCRKDNNPSRIQLAANILDRVKFPCYDNKYLRLFWHNLWDQDLPLKMPHFLFANDQIVLKLPIIF